MQPKPNSRRWQSTKPWWDKVANVMNEEPHNKLNNNIWDIIGTMDMVTTTGMEMDAPTTIQICDPTIQWTSTFQYSLKSIVLTQNKTRTASRRKEDVSIAINKDIWHANALTRSTNTHNPNISRHLPHMGSHLLNPEGNHSINHSPTPRIALSPKASGNTINLEDSEQCNPLP